MYLIISHFTQNKWTTDFLVDYLKINKKPHYYLRHPFTFEKELMYSEVIFFDGKNEIVISKYKKSEKFLLDLIRNFLLTFYIWIKYSLKVDKIIWFWWFNVFPILFLKIFWREIYFWWADYSKKRFWNNFLNKIYLSLETLSCKFSSKIINSSFRQEKARIENNWLKKEKSVIVNNWINKINFSKDFWGFEELSFFYLWSITHQHWIIDFVKYFYLDKKVKNKLYIIWGWELENNLIHLINENNLWEKVIFLWRKNDDEIIKFLESIDEKLIWIAPYSDKINDHVYYWDSLKIRAYLNYNIPFLSSSIVYISDDIIDFWIVYKDFSEISFEKLKNFSIDINKKNNVLSKYYWDNLLKIF